MITIRYVLVTVAERREKLSLVLASDEEKVIMHDAVEP